MPTARNSQETEGPPLLSLGQEPLVQTTEDSQNYFDNNGNNGNNTSYDEEMEGNWITVFGFPPELQRSVIDMLSSYGTIKQTAPPKGGNYIHLCFESKRSADAILNRNGKIQIQGNLIGAIKTSLSARSEIVCFFKILLLFFLLFSLDEHRRYELFLKTIKVTVSFIYLFVLSSFYIFY